MAIIPTMKQIRVGLMHRQAKEHIVYKIVLDVLAHYLKEFEQVSEKVRHFYYQEKKSFLKLL